MLHYLRIAVTTLSLTACVLLIALWVRSYWWADGIIRGTTSNKTFTFIASSYGAIEACSQIEPNLTGLPAKFRNRWGHFSVKARPVNQQFDWTANGREIRIEFPTWVPAILAVSLAAAPWIRWRFSLRTLLIATTLIAVVMGMVIYLAR
jgi:hypothetical protein